MGSTCSGKALWHRMNACRDAMAQDVHNWAWASLDGLLFYGLLSPQFVVTTPSQSILPMHAPACSGLQVWEGTDSFALVHARQ